MNEERLSAREQLELVGIDPQVLDQYLMETVGQAAAIQAQQQQTLASDPVFRQYGAQIAAHVQADPELAQQVARVAAVDFSAGMRLARDSWRAAVGPQQSPGAPRGYVNSDDSYTVPPEELRKRYQQTGSPADARNYARSRLHQTISDDFLNG